jgi:hypothetical protein
MMIDVQINRIHSGAVCKEIGDSDLSPANSSKNG